MIGIHGTDIEIDDPSLVDGAVKPDPHDPDYYCMVCETSSSDKTDYCNHLQQEHGIRFKTGKSKSLKQCIFIRVCAYLFFFKKLCSSIFT